ncbi:hypothetical protein BOSE21B_90798 [Bosea sp. 21B]|nr:hypothetical protein BOSE21B_90798 [Bosea sp. 21B]
MTPSIWCARFFRVAGLFSSHGTIGNPMSARHDDPVPDRLIRQRKSATIPVLSGSPGDRARRGRVMTAVERQ